MIKQRVKSYIIFDVDNDSKLERTGWVDGILKHKKAYSTSGREKTLWVLPEVSKLKIGIYF